MDPATWFPIVIIAMVLFAFIAFGIFVYLDKGE